MFGRGSLRRVGWRSGGWRWLTGARLWCHPLTPPLSSPSPPHGASVFRLCLVPCGRHNVTHFYNFLFPVLLHQPSSSSTLLHILQPSLGLPLLVICVSLMREMLVTVMVGATWSTNLDQKSPKRLNSEHAKIKTSFKNDHRRANNSQMLCTNTKPSKWQILQSVKRSYRDSWRHLFLQVGPLNANKWADDFEMVIIHGLMSRYFTVCVL